MIRLVVFDVESVLWADGAADMVTRCWSRHRLAAVSSDPDGNVAVKAALEATGWGAQIEIVVTPRESAAPLRAACSAMGTQVAEAALVTSRSDLAADAARAGLAVVWVGPGDGPAGSVAVDHLGAVAGALHGLGRVNPG